MTKTDKTAIAYMLVSVDGHPQRVVGSVMSVTQSVISVYLREYRSRHGAGKVPVLSPAATEQYKRYKQNILDIPIMSKLSDASDILRKSNVEAFHKLSRIYHQETRTHYDPTDTRFNSLVPKFLTVIPHCAGSYYGVTQRTADVLEYYKDLSKDLITQSFLRPKDRLYVGHYYLANSGKPYIGFVPHEAFEITKLNNLQSVIAQNVVLGLRVFCRQEQLHTYSAGERTFSNWLMGTKCPSDNEFTHLVFIDGVKHIVHLYSGVYNALEFKFTINISTTSGTVGLNVLLSPHTRGTPGRQVLLTVDGVSVKYAFSVAHDGASIVEEIIKRLFNGSIKLTWL